MLSKLLAEARAAAAAPVHPVTALMGAVCVVLGAGIVQRYVQQQQAGLAIAWHQLQVVAAGAQRVADAQADLAAAAPYPGPDDLDPVGRGDQADELGREFDILARATEGQDR